MTPHCVIRTGCVLVAIAGSGCSSHSSYPLTWPAVPKTAQRTCGQVVGTYRDQGQVSGSSYSPTRSLTEVLLGQNDRSWRAESVTLSFPRVEQIQIGVSGRQGQSSSATFTAEKGRFVCHTGSVMLQRPAVWSLGSGLGLGRESVTLELFSVEDYLVVKWARHRFMLLGFIVPAVDRDTDWCRFEATRISEGKTESTREVNQRGAAASVRE